MYTSPDKTYNLKDLPTEKTEKENMIQGFK